MAEARERRRPGQVRDAVLRVLGEAPAPLGGAEIGKRVSAIAGPVPRSSIQSCLSLNTPGLFVREGRGAYRPSTRPNLPLPAPEPPREARRESFRFGRAALFHAEALRWLDEQPARGVHAVVTDPPYGLHEYTPTQQRKLRERRGGVWRLPPSFDGHRRSPLPRFTTLTPEQLARLGAFFHEWSRRLCPRLVPGAHVFVASSPLLSFIAAGALARAGLERRGEIIRLTTTMRGGDRPKAAHDEFPEVSVMPRSMWEPWLLFREPLEGRVQDNLRRWKTGALRRPSRDKPFGDVIASAPTRRAERALAPHPSLKPQAFLRRLVRAALPLGKAYRIAMTNYADFEETIAYVKATGAKTVITDNTRNHGIDLAIAINQRLAGVNAEPSTNGPVPS